MSVVANRNIDIRQLATPPEYCMARLERLVATKAIAHGSRFHSSFPIVPELFSSMRATALNFGKQDVDQTMLNIRYL